MPLARPGEGGIPLAQAEMVKQTIADTMVGAYNWKVVKFKMGGMPLAQAMMAAHDEFFMLLDQYLVAGHGFTLPMEGDSAAVQSQAVAQLV